MRTTPEQAQTNCATATRVGGLGMAGTFPFLFVFVRTAVPDIVHSLHSSLLQVPTVPNGRFDFGLIFD